MDAEQHKQAAEDLLHEALDHPSPRVQSVLVARAQVHASLAQVLQPVADQIKDAEPLKVELVNPGLTEAVANPTQPSVAKKP